LRCRERGDRPQLRQVACLISRDELHTHHGDVGRRRRRASPAPTPPMCRVGRLAIGVEQELASEPVDRYCPPPS
jgi:hypothetical protein